MNSRRRVGYRFHPTDEEIISYFLKRKMDGFDSSVDNDITEIDLCKFEPWELPKYAAMEEPSNDQVWYFFCPRDFKYPNSRRANRTTKAGYWKSTGRDRKIKARRTKKEIGKKKTLVFYEGRVPDGIKTNWIIHEYQPITILPHQRALTLCKLKKKGDGNTDTQAWDEGETSNDMTTNLENPVESPIQQVDQELQVESIVIGNGLVFQYPPAMQQQVHVEQGPSFENTPFTNGFGYESNELVFRFDTNEEEEDPIKLADSFLVEPDDYSCRNTFANFPQESNYEETSNTPLNDSSPLVSVSRGYLESRCTAQCMGTSNLSVGNAGSKEYWQMQTIQELSETLPSSIHDWHEKEDIGSHSDEILVTEACSSGSDTENYIFCLISVRQVPDYETTNRPQRQKARKTRKHRTSFDFSETESSVNFPQKETLIMESDDDEAQIMEASSVGSDTESYISSLELVHEEVLDYPRRTKLYEDRKATKLGTAIDQPQMESSVNLPQKETFIMESENDLKMARAETSLKLRTIRSADNHGMSSFIHLEKSPLSRAQNPPSVYAAKVILGLVLFVFFSWQALIVH